MLDFGVWSGAGTTPQGALWKLFLDMSYEEFLPVIEAHWLSKAALTHAALEVMVPGGYGKIVNLCTDAGRVPTTNESMIGGAALRASCKCSGCSHASWGVTASGSTRCPVDRSLKWARSSVDR